MKQNNAITRHARAPSHYVHLSIVILRFSLSEFAQLGNSTVRSRQTA